MVPKISLIDNFQVSNLVLLSFLAWQGCNFIPATEGKYINTPCEADSDCGLDNHLQCIQSYCQCDFHSQIYDGSTYKCLLLAGQECQLESPEYQIRHKQHSHPMKCVPQADCIESVCQCKEGYRFSADFLCKPDFGSPCYTAEDCDDALGLTCTERGICDCQNSTLSYQGQFGCIDPNNPNFKEMLTLLNQTDQLLRENNLELKDMFNDLGLQNEDFSVEGNGNAIADERQFAPHNHDTYNTQDLQFASQNNAPQQQPPPGGGFNIQQIITLLQTFQSLIPRNNGGGGGGGFFRNLFGGGMNNNNNNQGGYPESSSPAPAGGYGPPGQPEGMGMRMGLLNNFLNLFNQMIPIVRQIRMRFMPLRFFRNLFSRFAPQTTAAPPPAQQVNNPPPTVIQSSGNYQTNPIFSSNQPAPPSQTQGTFQFFMRTRERFRNFLRGNRGQQQQGGYDSSPPASSYGPPGENPPPSGGDGGAEPASNQGGGDEPPPAPAPASSSHQSSYLNNHRPPPRQQQQQQQPKSAPNRSIYHGQGQQSQTQTHSQYTTIQDGGHQAIPPPHPTQRHQNFEGGNSNSNSHRNPSSSSYNSGNRPNHDHDGFYDGPQEPSVNQQPPEEENFQEEDHHPTSNNNREIDDRERDNNHHQSNHQQFNAQATSHRHQTTLTGQYKHPPSSFRPTPQSTHQYNTYNPNSNKDTAATTTTTKNNNFPSSSNSRPRQQFPHISGSASPPPIPRVKLPQLPSKKPASTLESLSQNFILSEADDPHPGFTPHSSSPAPPQQQESYRTSARFERIGRDEPQPSNHHQNHQNYNNHHQSTPSNHQHHPTNPSNHKISIDQKWRETF